MKDSDKMKSLQLATTWTLFIVFLLFLNMVLSAIISAPIMLIANSWDSWVESILALTTIFSLFQTTLAVFIYNKKERGK